MVVLVAGLAAPSHAVLDLGNGTGALVGSDLTDIGDDGVEGSYAPPNLAGFDATFFSSNEPGFGGGEFAFNVFDNVLSSRNGKWCCGAANESQIVGAIFTNTYRLTSFTVSSANDVPSRDPSVWRIEGSNDTTTGLDGVWTTIYNHATPGSDWATRFQVNQYSPADGDTFLTTAGFTAFRMVTDSTAGGATSGAFFQIGEIEFFGSTPVPEPATTTLAVLGLGGLMMRRRRNA